MTAESKGKICERTFARCDRDCPIYGYCQRLTTDPVKKPQSELYVPSALESRSDTPTTSK